MSTGWIAVRAIALSFSDVRRPSSIALSPTHDINTAATAAISDTLHRMNGVAAAERDRLPVHGFTGTPEEIERQWYEQIYRGRGDSMRQLTWRAVIMGSVLGGVLSLTNLYIRLKAGVLDPPPGP
jgi:hypothetical protein